MNVKYLFPGPIFQVNPGIANVLQICLGRVDNREATGAFCPGPHFFEGPKGQAKGPHNYIIHTGPHIQ